ncbi:hypothetical protein MKQ68_10335 [Chitinophaga horti]|uniref:Uncharacterized protein n=1 Tax=Chitinophaga horti TaxID=2920382 RepID=A0ABY6JAA8_9BACT|nr:hypothetical protein [Chitinophaga horti]UYQ95497.1 hypothetical protein MKQ68_10335 [Chitinophaga horti]
MKTTTASTVSTYYPGLDYTAQHISAFFQSGEGLFLLALKNRVVVRFYPEDMFDFLSWLEVNKIRKVS